jgi:cysteine-rich repeat protein
MKFLHVLIVILLAFFSPLDNLEAQQSINATTTLTISICGNSIVDGNEECDVPGETGVYSETIVGRQCTPVCTFGPYCGDGILQTQFGEGCDDGNNEDGDFCSSTCQIEPAGSGGGGSSGGGSGGRGGSDEELGDTLISIIGKAYPSQTINFLLDTENVGTVRSDGDGDFEFTTESSPGTATLGIWANDNNGVRSITLNNTFDVTQGAVTNINGVILPPTIEVANQNVDPGDVVPVSGQSVPDSVVELHINDSEQVLETTSNASGDWSVDFDTSTVAVAEHILRARTIAGNPPLTTESSFSTSLQLFVGVDGEASQPSDLNRDGSVNLIDFSILIFWWQTSGGDSDPSADINGNGNVGLEDFSILLFNWTG